jgi:signal transduction histidine kinase
MSARRRFLNSLQFKLILAFMSLVVAALFLSGALFVFLSQDKEEQRALDHSVAAAPTIHGGFLLHLLQGDSLSELETYVRDAAEASDVRILMIDESGQVIVDTKNALTGEQVPLPFEGQDAPNSFRVGGRYESWRPEAGSPASDLILVAPSPGQLPIEGGPRGQALVLPYRLVVAVTEASIGRAWLGLLPGLAIAAAIALPVAVALAVVTARYITGPLNRLTAAAHQMAEGTFDVDLPGSRGDEVGQLTQAFSGMATRVGDTYQQMRILVANVSHDVRTPLSSIRGFAQALRSGVMQGEAESRRAGEVIYDEAERLVSRLNDLIFLSELESGQAVLHREELNLRTLLDGVLGRLAPPAERKDGEVFLDVNQGITLSADRAKLERTLENLLGNARKFTPPGGEVRVRAYVDEAGGNKVCIEIANSAPDVEAEELPHLFERFYRRDRAGSGKSSGTGLGLPIARDLIELHGGTLEATLHDGDLILTARLPRT